MLKEVFFGRYCAECKHLYKDEDESPCDECLNTPSNEDSHKPIYFAEREKEK